MRTRNLPRFPAKPFRVYGEIAPKLVQVENKAGANAVDAYVRVQLVPTLRDGSGSNLGGNFPMAVPAGDQIVFQPFTDKELTVTLVFADGWMQQVEIPRGRQLLFTPML